MKFKILSLLLLTFFIVGISNCSFAQADESFPNKREKSHDGFGTHFQWINPRKPHVNEFQFMVGHSFHSHHGFWGKIKGATLTLFSLRYNRKILFFNDNNIIEYVGEINVADTYTLTTDQNKYPVRSYTGVGIAPIGFQFNFGKDNVIQPFFKSSGGCMYVNKRFPDRRGRKFNFTLELGLGLEFVLTPDVSFSLGYKYHHMSNGQFGKINPGVDSNIFYSGITIF